MIIGKLLNKGSRCLGSVCVCVCERIADPLKGRRKEKKKIDIMARETLYKRMSWSTGSGSISSTAERRAAFIRFRETPFPLSFPLYYVTATTFFLSENACTFQFTCTITILCIFDLSEMT